MTDILLELIRRFKWAAVGVLAVGVLAVWGAAHFSAATGETVRVFFGLAEYTKGQVTHGPSGSLIFTDVPDYRAQLLAGIWRGESEVVSTKCGFPVAGMSSGAEVVSDLIVVLEIEEGIITGTIEVSSRDGLFADISVPVSGGFYGTDYVVLLQQNPLGDSNIIGGRQATVHFFEFNEAGDDLGGSAIAYIPVGRCRLILDMELNKGSSVKK